MTQLIHHKQLFIAEQSVQKLSESALSGWRTPSEDLRLRTCYAERWLPLDDTTRSIFKEAQSGPVADNADYWWFRDQIEKAAQRCGMGHATTHQLRHTFASMQLKAGIPETVVSAWLGHKDSLITKRYSHLNRVLNEEYRNKIQIGERALSPVTRFERVQKRKASDFSLEIKGLLNSNNALPTGIEPVFPP